MDICIREALREDVAVIVAMLIDDMLGQGREDADDLAPYLAAFDAMAKSPNNTLYVACDMSGDIVGTFQLTYIVGLSTKACMRGELEAVRVARHLRGKGIGRQMLQWAIEKARADGCGLLQLTSNKQRTGAKAFYESLGLKNSHEGFKMSL